MELKRRKKAAQPNRRNGFNRTFMELKQSLSAEDEQGAIALIGPLWN